MLKQSSGSVRIFYPEFDKEEIIKRIRENLPALKKRLSILFVSLFGSYSKGNYTVSSDVDLIVVHRGEKRENAYSIVKKTIPIYGLEPHIYTEKEYQEMYSIIRKMIKGGVVIYREKGF